MKKKLSILILSWMVTFAAGAQGVSKLFGLVGGTVQNNHSSNGFLFKTDSSGTNLQVQYDFPVTVFGALPANIEMVPYNGKLYGTTSKGGIYDFGTIFEYDPATNIYTKKYDFGSNVNATAGTPKGSLLLYNNKFYGLAAEYGVNGTGAVFEWDPATNVYTKKLDFTGVGGPYPGTNPQNSLRLWNGKMYGTTAYGGGSNAGTVFEYDPVANTINKLLELTGTNGAYFYGNVTVYNNKLYCMSQQGAANNYGALYVIDPSLPYGSNTTVLQVFDGTTGGTGNNNEMVVHNNKLYSCLQNGGTDASGTLFELDPATNTFTKLADFNYYTTGRGPLGKLVPNGSKFLGMCNTGGTNGTGTIFEWDPANPTVLVNKLSFGPNNFDNPINPIGTFSIFNSKLYTTTYNGGFVNQGTLLEYDPASGSMTKKLNFNAAENGRIPHGRPVLMNGKIYGICYQGPKEIYGTPYGCLWSFDPSTSVYSRKFLFDDANGAANGRAPNSSPVAYNGKLYGTTVNGGTSDVGVLYEYDPVTNIYVKKDMQPIGGSFPIGEPTLYNNKFYGLTSANGTGNFGIIYSYDPATGVLAKLYDVQNSGVHTPGGGFAVYNDKLYFTANSGAANNIGGIVAYDPVANTAAVVYDLVPSLGSSIYNAMTLYNNKFYGTTLGGGTGGRGTIFEFDPAANNYTVVHNFTTIVNTDGYDPKGGLTISGNKLYCITQESNSIVKVIEFDPATNTVTTRSTHNVVNLNTPVSHNGLTVVPAFIANGTPGSCENYPTVVIDGTNNMQWVPIMNTAGDVVAEIKANGNSLGNVTASTYINSGAPREDSRFQMYLDRNISITVQNQPSSNVDIRLYLKTSEYLALKNASNSQGQPSGITSINDIIILKNQQSCSATMSVNPSKLITTASAYEYGYVLSASVNSFSTFFFAKSSYTLLPIKLISFDAAKQNNSVKLNWKTENEVDMANFEVQKSNTVTNFASMATVAPRGGPLQNNYTIYDNAPFAGSNYYRLRSVDRNGRSSYSDIVRVDFIGKATIAILPNPAHDHIIITGVADLKQVQIIDASGKMVRQMNKAADNRYSVAGLTKGVYWIRLIGGMETVTNKIIIE